MFGYVRLAAGGILRQTVLPWLAAVAMISCALYWWSANQEFRDSGVTTGAEVLSRDESGAFVQVRYRYRDTYGDPHEHSRPLLLRRIYLLGGARTLPVTFLPYRPSEHYLGPAWLATAKSTGAVLFGLLAVPLLVWGAVKLTHQVGRLLALAALFRTGGVAGGEVREYVAERPSLRPDRFKYVYVGPNGRWYESLSPPVPARIRKRLPVGAKLPVVYDRGQPSRSEPDVFGLTRR